MKCLQSHFQLKHAQRLQEHETERDGSPQADRMHFGQPMNSTLMQTPIAAFGVEEYRDRWSSFKDIFRVTSCELHVVRRAITAFDHLHILGLGL